MTLTKKAQNQLNLTLRASLQKNDMVAIVDLLNQGAIPPADALFVANKHRNVTLAQLMIDHGVDVNTRGWREDLKPGSGCNAI